MTMQPAVRIFLTFLVAALSTVVATVDDQTIRLICAPIVSGLAAIGIVPPQLPTRTVANGERGTTAVEAVVIVFVAILAVYVLLRVV